MALPDHAVKSMTLTEPETQAEPRTKFRKDYQPPAFWIREVALDFELGEDGTVVDARLTVERNAAADATAPLVLDGEDLETLEVALDGVVLGADRYSVEAERLLLADVPDRFELRTRVRIHPESNTKLSGLYKSSGNFCTQCEAEGFRRITWFLDRPDVMARFRVSLTAEKARYPVLLSNGNRVAVEDAGGGKHRARWEDPFLKPAYLFALVAGDLHCHEGDFTTKSGRAVRCEVWVEHKDSDKAAFALASLQKAMKWDEDAFGLEYDLDLYMIVAVGDFNMGAMENKGLNIFNSKFVLARPDTATDGDYEGIESVIAHEYFHNWTGNRVTCRDWFQLTLKEGLTVYRDQRFTMDVRSAAVKRIEDVRNLRASQFQEDAGPMAHPIRPEQYIEMNNFYTATVYEKGAQVIQMYEQLLGRQGFRRGMDLYFQRHDGSAVTCDDFRAAMADANGRDLSQFERWYLQKGTPTLIVHDAYDAEQRTFKLTLRQEAPPNEPNWKPCHVPVRTGLIGPDGRGMRMALSGEDVTTAPTERMLELTGVSESWTFYGVQAQPLASVLRGFSAPMHVSYERTREELAFQLGCDSDPFNRWDAGQALFTDVLLEGAQLGAKWKGLDTIVVEAVRKLLRDEHVDGAFKALALVLTPEVTLQQLVEVVDPGALTGARDRARRELCAALRNEIVTLHARLRPTGPYTADASAIDRRRLANTLLALMTAADPAEAAQRAYAQFEAADNMTDSQAALAALCELDVPERDRALATFHARWQGEALVLDKWFTLQAASRTLGTAAHVRALLGHADFTLDNPNRVRALVGAFAMSNFAGFHAADGAGYRVVADVVMQLDGKNPQVASRIVRSLNMWKRLEPERGALMKVELQRIAAQQGLSKDVYEIVSRALA
ncbi:MAG: aminopeptidase N [Planctomycetota bacterium]